MQVIGECFWNEKGNPQTTTRQWFHFTLDQLGGGGGILKSTPHRRIYPCKRDFMLIFDVDQLRRVDNWTTPRQGFWLGQNSSITTVDSSEAECQESRKAELPCLQPEL